MSYVILMDLALFANIAAQHENRVLDRDLNQELVTAQEQIKPGKFDELQTIGRGLRRSEGALVQRVDLEERFNEEDIGFLSRSLVEDEERWREAKADFSASEPTRDLDPYDRGQYAGAESGPLRVSGMRFLASEQTNAEAIFSAADMNEILEQTLPHHWTHDKVESVVQDENESTTPDAQYGLNREGWKTVARHIPGRDGHKNRIVLTSASEASSVDYSINGTIPHEFAHANDWDSRSEVNPEARAELLLRVADRVQSEDRYRSSYVESINSEDKKEELRVKAGEYWAEICSVYFTDYNKLNVKDFILVDDWVKRFDPGFDVRKASDKRQDIIRRVAFQGFIGQL